MSRRSTAAKATVHKLARREASLSLVASGKWHPLGAEVHNKSFVKSVRAWTPNQDRLMSAIRHHDITLAVGPAGTGKTYLTVVEAVSALDEGRIKKIIISRPVVEAGEKLGYLPGGLNEKLDPWMRPVYDALSERLGAANLRRSIGDGVIEIAPLAFMRGRTLSNAFVIIDEAQNMTYQQLVMALSRLGFGSTMVITGDPDQTDLLPELSGLSEIIRRLEALDAVAIVRLTAADIVRHPLVAAMMPLLA
ncbi:MAG: PhoH family protein [Rhodospirillaceae bacterium]